MRRLHAARGTGLRRGRRGRQGKAEEACVDCHGDDGKGDDDYPGIAGMSVDKFTKAIQEYQNGTRTKSPKMTKEAKKLSATDIANLAAYYSTLK